MQTGQLFQAWRTYNILAASLGELLKSLWQVSPLRLEFTFYPYQELIIETVAPRGMVLSGLCFSQQ